MNWRKVAAGFTAALLSVTTASIFPTKTVFAADVCVIDTDTEHQMFGDSAESTIRNGQEI